ncbi:uncharacterized protein LOC131862033 [Cryptomeria japonica]|uniref:uncharacterized protein LOC131862033 n=1 Tax=Cryptomeria japonica TaxID=3369 RepID=UPI0027DA0F02|nr:uncharacterized protein LOC131862033 [Cryptomeria japonica]
MVGHLSIGGWKSRGFGHSLEALFGGHIQDVRRKTMDILSGALQVEPDGIGAMEYLRLQSIPGKNIAMGGGCSSCGGQWEQEINNWWRFQLQLEIGEQTQGGSGYFKFQIMWWQDSTILNNLEKWWNQCNHIKGTPSLCFIKNLAYIKNQLKTWNKESFKNIFSEKERIENELEALNSKVMTEGMDQIDFNREKDLTNKLSEILIREEIYWKDKARELWIGEGDMNTKFFHASVKTRRAKNQINEILLEDGSWLKDRDSIGSAAEAYFKKILNAEEEKVDLSLAMLLDAVLKLVNKEDNQMLMQPFSEEEIRSAVLGLHPDKAPGLDGMPAIFYQKCWGFVKSDLMKVVEQVRIKGKFVREINNTVLVAIPKKPNPSTFDDLRPIALCNTIYKIITKALANRLKKVLPNIISLEQNGFTPGREIIDSIILTTKTMHSITTVRLKAMVIKLDISKAYDKTRISKLFGWKIGLLPAKYLGVPLFSGNTKVEVWKELIIRCRQKTEAWRHKWLALPGRIQLIKSVLTAMPIYAMSVFKLPLKVVQALESFFKKFLWEGAKQIKKIPLISWDIACSPKDEGGAGLRSLQLQNWALGRNWIGEAIGKYGEHVADYIREHPPGSGRHEWIKFRVNGMEDADINRLTETLKSRKIVIRDMEDKIIMCAAQSRQYSVKLGYQVQRSVREKCDWPTSLCWDKMVAPRAGAFLWAVMHERILTGERLKMYGICGPSICVMCKSNEETINHLLMECPFARQCWNWLCQSLRWVSTPASTLKNWIKSWPILNQKSLWGSLWLIAPSMLLWQIWKERNCRIFEGKENSLEKFLEKIKTNISEVANLKSHCRRIEYISDWDKKNQMEWGNLHPLNINVVSKQAKWSNAKWEPPKAGWIKLNFDGAAKGNPGAAGYGSIIRDEKGTILGSISGSLGTASNNEAEAMALVRGLKYCSEKNYQYVEVEGDSQILVNAIKNGATPSWKL